MGRNTLVPMMPPMAPPPISVADVKARFHWPRMLFDWYVNKAGQFALHAMVAKRRRSTARRSAARSPGARDRGFLQEAEAVSSACSIRIGI